MAAFPDAHRRTERVVVRSLRRRDCDAAIALLTPSSRDDLFLLDLVRQIPAPGDAVVDVIAAWRGATLLGLAALRPTIVLQSGLAPPVRDALMGPLSDVTSGLIRCDEAQAGELWARFAVRGRRAIVDRRETSLVLERAWLRGAPTPAGVAVRPAATHDLEALVEAARASLREEGRPDPFLGDPKGFRRWVAARVARAHVAELGGEAVWAGYADVRLREGHLLQGIYTWPSQRRRGIAAAGVCALCRAAFASGADHVQLSVVEGNAAARDLYVRLGFRPHATLRTILFA
jgi:RimJ/RimL family protein N-acetyltransferase